MKKIVTLSKLSIYVQKEIWWGFYGNEKGRNAEVVINSYANNDTYSANALGATFGSLRLLYGNHTHPSLVNINTHPSEDDIASRNAKYYNFIWSPVGVSQYDGGGKIYTKDGRDLIRDYNKEMNSTYNKEYLKGVLKWKKQIQPIGVPARR